MKKKLIAETAWHHQGNEEFMLKLVDELCLSRADCIKVHLLMDVDEYIDPDHDLYEKYSKWSLPEIIWRDIFKKISDSGKDLIALCNDKKSIDFAVRHDIYGLELHAVTIHDIHLFNHLMEMNPDNSIKVFVGAGSLPITEIDALYHGYNMNFVLMFGIQNYPTRPEYVALARQRKLMNLYPRATFGYADHTEWDHPDNLLISIMGGLDKKYLEKHVTLTPGDKRVDFESAISLNQFNHLRSWLDLVEQMEGNGQLAMNHGESSYGQVGPMRKAMITNREFKKGEFIEFNGICFKRTSQVSDLIPVMYDDINKYIFKKTTPAGSVINRDMIERPS